MLYMSYITSLQSQSITHRAGDGQSTMSQSTMSQSTMSSSLLTVILIIAVITAGCQAEQVYYVTPNATKSCLPTARPGTCQTLRQYVNKSEEYFQSDTTFYFLSGTHWLDIQEPVVILGMKKIQDDQ